MPSKSKEKKKKKKAHRSGPRSRDPHWLYQESVQSPEVNIDFIDRQLKFPFSSSKPIENQMKCTIHAKPIA